MRTEVQPSAGWLYRSMVADMAIEAMLTRRLVPNPMLSIIQNILMEVLAKCTAYTWVYLTRSL